MPKYRVRKDGPAIVYGDRGIFEEERKKGRSEAESGKAARKVYQPGDMIELSEEDARKIVGSLEIAQEKQAAESPPLDDPKEEARESKKKTK